MIRNAFNYLVNLGNREIREIKGRSYSEVAMFPIKNPLIKPLQLHTLTGLVDYCTSDQCGNLETGKIFIHVASQAQVDLYGPLSGDWKERDHALSVILDSGSPFNFGEWYDHEQFIIEIQSKFVQDENTAQILRLNGNIVDETVKSFDDDGISQGVHVRAAINLPNRKEAEKVPNPVTLRPYRTFQEIEQPPSSFIHRLRRGGPGELPKIALFDADGGRWKNEAIIYIKEWLADRLPEMTIIA